MSKKVFTKKDIKKMNSYLKSEQFKKEFKENEQKWNETADGFNVNWSDVKNLQFTI